MVKNIEIENYYSRNWLQVYSNQIIIFLITVIISFILIIHYKHYKNYQDILANEKFNIILYAMSINDSLTVKNQAIELLPKSSRTPYPSLSGLMLAKVFIMENNFIEAEKILNTVMNKQNLCDNLWHLANLRLIKVLLLQNKFIEAEKNIDLGISNKKFSSSYHELLGDLLIANNKILDANVQYKKAIDHLPENVIDPWLQLKSNEISSISN